MKSSRAHHSRSIPPPVRLSPGGTGWLAVALIASAIAPAAAADFHWDPDGDLSAEVGGSGTWEHINAYWRLGTASGPLGTWPVAGPNNDAFLQGIGGNIDLVQPIVVNDLTVNPTIGIYTLDNTGLVNSIRLGGARPSVIDVGLNATLQGAANTAWLAEAGFAKRGPGHLNLAGTYNMTGGVRLVEGTMETGVSTLRANHVTIGADALYLKANGLASTMGTVSGAGTILLLDGQLLQTPMSSGTYAGTILTSGAYFLRGSNGATQTFNGNVSGMTGAKTIFSGASMTLAGAGGAVDGAWGSGAISLRDGTLTLDNSAGNTSMAEGRIPDASALNFHGGGGTLSLIGSPTGTVETVGLLTAQSGPVTLRVSHQGGAGGTELRLSNGTNLAAQTSTTFDFVGVGGTLGTGGANPRIILGTVPFQNTTSGMLARAASGAATLSTGWAVVNGNRWAGYDPVNGVVALADTARDSSTLEGAGAFELTAFAPSAASTALTANLRTAASPLGALKITPTGPGQSLEMGTFSMAATALMLDGPESFTINATTGAFTGGTSTKAYVWVNDPSAVLTYGGRFQGGSVELTKTGPGFLAITNPTPNLPGSTSTNMQNGVFRAPIGALTATNVRINFRGTGVLELSGGGTYQPTLGAGNDAGGTVNFGTSADNTLGNGGFSAFGGDAVVTIRSGGNPATLNWEANQFLRAGYAFTFGSIKSDSLLTLTNNINLITAASANHVAREFRVADNPDSTSDATRLSGVVSGAVREVDLLKTGSGVLQMTGFSTYTGNTLVHQGILQIGALGGPAGAADGNLFGTSKVLVDPGATLRLGGTTTSNNRINDNAAMVLNGGTFDTGSLREGDEFFAGMGALTLTADATLDFNGVNGLLHFADSSGAAWSSESTDFFLSIFDWTSGGADADRLFFGTDNTALTPAQLGQIRFYADDGVTLLGTGAWAGADGEVTVVPEPGVSVMLVVAGAMAGLGRQRRRTRPASGK